MKGSGCQPWTTNGSVHIIWTIQNVWWAVLNPKGSVVWMRNFEGFCRSMLNHRKLSIRLYRTKKVLSANAEPCRVLSANAEPCRVLPIKFWTIGSFLLHYTEPKRFCRQILNLEGFCRSMLNHRKFSVRLYRTKKVLSRNTEPWRVLPINAEPYKIFCWRILNHRELLIPLY